MDFFCTSATQEWREILDILFGVLMIMSLGLGELELRSVEDKNSFTSWCKSHPLSQSKLTSFRLNQLQTKWSAVNPQYKPIHNLLALPLSSQWAVSPAKTIPILPVTVLWAPLLTAMSDIASSSDCVSFMAQNICKAGTQAWEATLLRALQMLPKHNKGKNILPNAGANISIVMPTVNMISDTYFHLLMLCLLDWYLCQSSSEYKCNGMYGQAYRKLLDAYDVNISLPAIPAMSRTRKLRVAESAVAPDLPTPTPSKTLCVASTERRDVIRYCMLSSSIHERYLDS